MREEKKRKEQGQEVCARRCVRVRRRVYVCVCASLHVCVCMCAFVCARLHVCVCARNANVIELL